MLYTKKGDSGTTKLFNCPSGVRLPKSDRIFSVLGTLDELNSAIGYTKVLSREYQLSLYMKEGKVPYINILEIFQQHLFCIQAELGGSLLSASKEQVHYLEEVIYEVETLLPPITSFIIPGGGEAAASLDIARTVARRAERECVCLRDSKEGKISETSLKFLNRLSSALYALARFANYQEGYTEKKPSYN
jgi:cob(I)alamin adenosyltransferase